MSAQRNLREYELLRRIGVAGEHVL
jgi:hypothetical protein